MTPWLIFASIALILYACRRLHQRCRIVEESELVLSCGRCSKPLAFDEFENGKVVRLCPDGHRDVRRPMDACSCGGHLAYNGERAGDVSGQFLRDKTCARCDTGVTYTMRDHPRPFCLCADSRGQNAPA